MVVMVQHTGARGHGPELPDKSLGGSSRRRLPATKDLESEGNEIAPNPLVPPNKVTPWQQLTVDVPNPGPLPQVVRVGSPFWTPPPSTPQYSPRGAAKTEVSEPRRKPTKHNFETIAGQLINDLDDFSRALKKGDHGHSAVTAITSIGEFSNRFTNLGRDLRKGIPPDVFENLKKEIRGASKHLETVQVLEKLENKYYNYNKGKPSNNQPKRRMVNITIYHYIRARRGYLEAKALQKKIFIERKKNFLSRTKEEENRLLMYQNYIQQQHEQEMPHKLAEGGMLGNPLLMFAEPSSVSPNKPELDALENVTARYIQLNRELQSTVDKMSESEYPLKRLESLMVEAEKHENDLIKHRNDAPTTMFLLREVYLYFICLDELRISLGAKWNYEYTRPMIEHYLLLIKNALEAGQLPESDGLFAARSWTLEQFLQM